MSKKYDIEERGPITNLCMPQLDGYTIGQWCESSDGTGKPVAVVVSIDFERPVIIAFSKDDIGETDRIALRFKSRHGINTFIEILERHRDDVFPLN